VIVRATFFCRPPMSGPGGLFGRVPPFLKTKTPESWRACLLLSASYLPRRRGQHLLMENDQ
jgi:hypothetical protein